MTSAWWDSIEHRRSHLVGLADQYIADKLPDGSQKAKDNAFWYEIGPDQLAYTNCTTTFYC